MRKNILFSITILCLELNNNSKNVEKTSKEKGKKMKFPTRRRVKQQKRVCIFKQQVKIMHELSSDFFSFESSFSHSTPSFYDCFFLLRGSRREMSLGCCNDSSRYWICIETNWHCKSWMWQVKHQISHQFLVIRNAR